MEEHHAVDDQSHYEISLTAGQAFVAFVLLLLSLAASFAFGLMLGKGQADERLVVRKETPIVSESALVPKKNAGQIVELGVSDDDFADAETETTAATSTPASTNDTAATATAVTPIIEDLPLDTTSTAPQPPPTTTVAVAAPAAVPHIAQLLSTGDQKTAEALAVRVINRGFNTAYVERGSTDKGPIYRVRVRFDSEPEARAAEPKLREFSKEVWITAK
ncbi:MAG: SPOR domain-containing protein [Acidobacteriota bacterium]|nr:SPOR domain-containing protein [Acidobacteriota bacterium]